MLDVEVIDMGLKTLLRPLTPRGVRWLRRILEAPGPIDRYGPGVIVLRRDLSALMGDALAAGLVAA